MSLRCASCGGTAAMQRAVDAVLRASDAGAARPADRRRDAAPCFSTVRRRRASARSDRGPAREAEDRRAGRSPSLACIRVRAAAAGERAAVGCPTCSTAEAYRGRILLFLLRQPQDAASRALLREIVRTGSKGEAVAATHALCGLRMTSLAHVRESERKHVVATCEPVDLAWVSGTTAHKPTTHYWVPADVLKVRPDGLSVRVDLEVERYTTVRVDGPSSDRVALDFGRCGRRADDLPHAGRGRHAPRVRDDRNGTRTRPAVPVSRERSGAELVGARSPTGDALPRRSLHGDQPRSPRRRTV